MRTALVLAALVLVAPALAPAADAAFCARTSTGLPPLTDLGAGTYLGFQGGLYPGGSNERPAAHTSAGLALASLAVPRSALGAPDPANGKLVFLSIGMSNTRNEFTQFVPMANADPLKHPRVLVVNGAIGGQPAETIASPSAAYWSDVDALLAQAGATPAQVQAVWLKQANRGPTGTVQAEAERLEADLAAIVQILKVRFPHLNLVYLSSRIYAGYASTSLNPEPFAHGSGFSVKWLVEDQIAGTYALDHPTRGVVAPWLSWGPYLWADGLSPRGDGLTWACSELAEDGTHPNAEGSRKVARALLDFVHADETAKAWYERAGGLGA